MLDVMEISEVLGGAVEILAEMLGIVWEGPGVEMLHAAATGWYEWLPQARSLENSVSIPSKWAHPFVLKRDIWLLGCFCWYYRDDTTYPKKEVD